MIKVIKKEDVLKRLDDPRRDDIERRLGEMRKLKKFVQERPSRAEFILSQLREFTIELETSANAG